jgi:hypothetical protein
MVCWSKMQCQKQIVCYCYREKKDFPMSNTISFDCYFKVKLGFQVFNSMCNFKFPIIKKCLFQYKGLTTNICTFTYKILWLGTLNLLNVLVVKIIVF